MVAKVTVPGSIKRALNYNEQKMQQGKAECIYAHNYLKDAENMNFYEKLQQFESLIALNQRAETNTLHVSLNFYPSEKFSNQKLTEIATMYMENIGFSEQPYLVYQHTDAGHPHIHIVSTNIKKDGKRISLHNIGRNQSTKARKEIEQHFNLIKSEDQKKKIQETITSINVQRIVYGKSETKQSITNILNAVINQYKYTSLPELNAVLRLYNLTADRGKENSQIHKMNGLVYRVLDEKGNKIGVPVKASSIYSKPTLANLEKRFIENEPLRQHHKKSLKSSIDWIMLNPPKDLEGFRQALQLEKISLVIRQNNEGIVYGITYIDQRSKCVFNGSDIGKEYSAKLILEKCKEIDKAKDEKQFLTAQNTIKSESVKDKSLNQSITSASQFSNILDALTNPTEEFNPLPYGLRRKRKTKRKKQ